MKRRLLYLLLVVIAAIVAWRLLVTLVMVATPQPHPVFHAPNGRPIPKS